MMDKLELVRPMKRRKLGRHNSRGLSSSLFSEDIMTEIFLWLPLNSLVRFKRLSKRWYFLITDQQHNSTFRRNYLSTLSSRRRRNRILGRSDDDGIMAGFFSRKPVGFGISYDQVRFLPSTSTQFKKYYSPPQGGKSTTEIININKINHPFLSFEESSLNEFLWARLREDGEYYPPGHDQRLSLGDSLDKLLSSCLNEDEEYHPTQNRKTFLAASSNGFLLFTLHSGFSHSIDFLVNPVTMEWLPLPPLEANESGIFVGFVCKGDYPSLDLVEYTIVRLSWLDEQVHVDLLFQLFSNGDNEWTEYRVSCESLQVELDLCGDNNSVIVSTTNNNQGGDGGSRILLYFLVMVRLTRTIAIVAVGLNEGDDPSLQMFETPGPDRGISVSYCADYIREFDDGRVIHYVRFCCSTDFEFWVLNTESGEWYLKHRASLETMMMKTKGGYPWTNVKKWDKACMFPKPYEAIARYHIHGFHPMNPDHIFLTLYGRFVCYNVETSILELVYDFDAQNMRDDYCHFVYQWPCWPPLL